MTFVNKVFNWVGHHFLHRVLLCDLDGTLIVTRSGKTFPENENDWVFKNGIKDAIIRYNPKYIFIVSNQGGIEKGFVNEKKFMAKFRQIMKEIRTWGDFIVDGTYCTANGKNNEYRKPNTGMIDHFRHDFIDGYDFDSRDALMIGDASGKEGQFSDSDIQCAKNAGIKYCDVDDFIWANDPCLKCDLEVCGQEEFMAMACDRYGTGYRGRLKSVITTNK